MTLWGRISSGVWLCAGVAASWGAANLLLASGHPALKGLGGALAVFAFSFGAIFFALGALIVLGGVFLHLRDAKSRRPDV